MFRTRPLAVLFVALVVTADTAAQEESWVGRTVVLSGPGVRIGHTSPTGEQVFAAELTDSAYTVLREENGWLMVRQGGVRGPAKVEQPCLPLPFEGKNHVPRARCRYSI